jgi:hypothetical protein
MHLHQIFSFKGFLVLSISFSHLEEPCKTTKLRGSCNFYRTLLDWKNCLQSLSYILNFGWIYKTIISKKCKQQSCQCNCISVLQEHKMISTSLDLFVCIISYWVKDKDMLCFMWYLQKHDCNKIISSQVGPAVIIKKKARCSLHRTFC